jgi:hypothetical protein
MPEWFCRLSCRARQAKASDFAAVTRTLSAVQWIGSMDGGCTTGDTSRGTLGADAGAFAKGACCGF